MAAAGGGQLGREQVLQAHVMSPWCGETHRREVTNVILNSKAELELV